MEPIEAQELWEQSARVRRQSRALRAQVADIAERVAEIEDKSAAIHESMATHAGPLIGAAERAEHARKFAAAERALSRSYRQQLSPEVVEQP
jgi:hypothetical protein